MWDQGLEEWDLGSGIRDHKPLDHDSRLIKFKGLVTKNFYAFGIKDQKFGYKKGISNEKKIPFCDPEM